MARGSSKRKVTAILVVIASLFGLLFGYFGCWAADRGDIRAVALSLAFALIMISLVLILSGIQIEGSN